MRDADVVPGEAVDPQRERVGRYAVADSVDIHCHCLPGLDDGPPTLDDAVALCRALVADGITVAIATPHQLGNFGTETSASVIRGTVATLRQRLAQADVPLRVECGADVRVDDRLGDLLDRDQVMTLADGGAYVLLELPHESLVNPKPLLKSLADRGLKGILSHPERQANIVARPDMVLPWLEHGAFLQVTAGSLLGHFGPRERSVAWHLIENGLVSLIASDAHDASARPPVMTAAVDAISKRVGHAIARRLCLENPLRVLNGQTLQLRGAWSRQGVANGR